MKPGGCRICDAGLAGTRHLKAPYPEPVESPVPMTRSRFYHKDLERFLSPQEVMDRNFRPNQILIYPLEPAVILIHRVDEEQHHEDVYLGDELIFSCTHAPTPAPDHPCSEIVAMRLARALDTKVDERRVNIDEWREANKKAVAAGRALWHLVDFSETVEWPNRGGFKQ